MTARTSHRFTASHVETRWHVRRRAGGAHTVDVLFPSWGRRTAGVWAVTRAGRRLRVAAAARSGARVAYLHVRSVQSGYVVVPATRARFTVHTIRPERQSTAPNPGPTLVARLADRERFRAVAFTARLAPGRTPAEAARVAARMRAR